jgi:hypothetical protein
MSVIDGDGNAGLMQRQAGFRLTWNDGCTELEEACIELSVDEYQT